MDNATHALAGLLVAQAAILLRNRRGERVTATEAGALRWVSALANNLNDLDFTYASRLGGKIGYLLHHRGHSHTLLLCPALGLSLFGIWWGVSRWRGRAPSRQQTAWLLLLALLGPFVHIGLDALNNYGVHPLWPFDARWFYGDSLFIIEPWLWVVLVPALASELTSRVARAALAAVLGVGLALAWGLDMASWPVALLLTVGSAASAWLCRRLTSAARFAYALTGVLLTLASFAGGASMAHARVRQPLLALERGTEAESLRDVVITPAPGNPLCFGAVSVSVTKEAYRVRSASISLIPTVVSAAACRIQATGLTVGLSRATLASTPALRWEGEWHASIEELRLLNQEHCQVEAMLRFARVPFWRSTRRTALLLGDLRFDRDPELDFDEFEVPRTGGPCPTHVPNWVPPRSDVLNGD